MIENQNLVEVKNLKKYFNITTGMFSSKPLKALTGDTHYHTIIAPSEKALQMILQELQEKLGKLQCPVVRFSSSTPLPLEIGYRTPGTLGSDRIAAAVGAWNEAPGRNLLIIDAGTAITVDFVGKDGKYNGGNIAPGIKMRLRALHEYTSRLPMVDKEGDTPAIGYDTETAIRSGVINGICHEIEGYINEFKQKYCDLLVFLTGGDEKPLKNRIKNCIFADKYLVAKGLNRILTDYGNK